MKKINTIMISAMIILLLALIVWAATSYRVNVGQTAYINEQAVCKKVVNTAGAADIFVPTKTGSEWSSFYNNVPTGVSATSVTCCAGAGTSDTACGTAGNIDCNLYYAQTGTESSTTTETCYNKADITTLQCEGNENCKDANTADCSSQANFASQYTCGTCKYISSSNCLGTTLGSCTNYGYGTNCGSNLICETGSCIKDLYLSVHDATDCTALGGIVYTVSGTTYSCKFTAATCPVGWTQYSQYSTTASNSCSASCGGTCGCSCTTTSHTFANTAPETCLYYSKTWDGYTCSTTGTYTCTAGKTEIGCY